MKKVLLTLLITLTANVYAQEINCEEFVQTEFINKIKNYKPTDLVPYSTDGENWGLMDVKSKKILTKPLMEDPDTFIPELRFTAVNDCRVNIQNYDSFVTHQTMTEINANNKSKATMETLGFEVDEDGKMNAYSKSYKTKDWDSWNISEPIKYKNEYFAVLYKENDNVLINQKGEEQKGFTFKEIRITPYLHKNEPLFYIEDFNGKLGFITFSGKKVLYGKLLSYYYGDFGYSVQNNRKDDIKSITKSGVLDLTNQKWLIKPQAKYKIYDIIYTSSEEINTSNSKDREKANIYFLATENGTEHFVLDINGKQIKPKL